MAITPTRPGWRRPPTLRDPDPQEERHPSWLELFFDLCFVAAVAALAADLHHDPTWGGIARFCGLFVPVWWAWMGYTWYASAFDNDDAVFRVSWFAAMGLVIAMAAGVDTISSGGSGEFAIAYATLQLLLAALFLRARRHAEGWRGFATRYAAGDALGGAIWLASAAVPEPARYVFWAAGMVVLMATPPLAVVAYAGKAFDAAHIAERYGLFTLIVLGESVASATVAVQSAIDSGSRFGDLAEIAIGGLLIVFSMWWVYFAQPAERTVDANALQIGMVHDAGPSRGRIERMRARFPDASAVVYGHSHIPLHEEADDGFQLFNPGSPTDRRRQPRHTMGLARVTEGRVSFELIALD